jgi:hypothetical protein
MKKIYSAIILFMPFLFQTVNAQSNLASVEARPVPSYHSIKGSNMSFIVNDTLVPPSFGSPLQCDTAPKLYGWSAPATGDVYGNNSFGETQCAQKYYATGTISEVLAWIGYKAGTTGSSSAKVYSIDAVKKGPSSTVLGTSAAVTTGSISTVALTSYAFTPAVSVTSMFALSVVFPTTTGDTVSVVSNVMGCSTSDSLSWVNFPSGWRSTLSAISSHPNTDLWIFPVGAALAGVSEYSTTGLSLLGAYPNPAKDFTSLKYRTDMPGLVSIEVFDLTGRVIANTSETLNAGTHEIKISLKDLVAGNYYYTVKTGSAQLTSKFAVVK